MRQDDRTDQEWATAVLRYNNKLFILIGDASCPACGEIFPDLRWPECLCCDFPLTFKGPCVPEHEVYA